MDECEESGCSEGGGGEDCDKELNGKVTACSTFVEKEGNDEDEGP